MELIKSPLCPISQCLSISVHMNNFLQITVSGDRLLTIEHRFSVAGTVLKVLKLLKNQSKQFTALSTIMSVYLSFNHHLFKQLSDFRNIIISILIK